MSNSNKTSRFKKYVVLTPAQYESLKSSSLNSLQQQNLTPVEEKMLEVLKNRNFSPAQRLRFYQQLLFTHISGKNISGPARTLSNNTILNDLPTHDALPITHDALAITHKSLINQATSGKFEREEFLLPNTSTPNKRVLKHKRVDELKKDFKKTRCDIGDEKEGVAGETTGKGADIDDDDDDFLAFKTGNENFYSSHHNSSSTDMNASKVRKSKSFSGDNNNHHHHPHNPETSVEDHFDGDKEVDDEYSEIIANSSTPSPNFRAMGISKSFL